MNNVINVELLITIPIAELYVVASSFGVPQDKLPEGLEPGVVVENLLAHFNLNIIPDIIAQSAPRATFSSSSYEDDVLWHPAARTTPEYKATMQEIIPIPPAHRTALLSAFHVTPFPSGPPSEVLGWLETALTSPSKPIFHRDLALAPNLWSWERRNLPKYFEICKEITIPRAFFSGTGDEKRFKASE